MWSQGRTPSDLDLQGIQHGPDSEARSGPSRRDLDSSKRNTQSIPPQNVVQKTETATEKEKGTSISFPLNLIFLASRRAEEDLSGRGRQVKKKNKNIHYIRVIYKILGQELFSHHVKSDNGLSIKTITSSPSYRNLSPIATPLPHNSRLKTNLPSSSCWPSPFGDFHDF